MCEIYFNPIHDFVFFFKFRYFFHQFRRRLSSPICILKNCFLFLFRFATYIRLVLLFSFIFHFIYSLFFRFVAYIFFLKNFVILFFSIYFGHVFSILFSFFYYSVHFPIMLDIKVLLNISSFV